MTIEKYLKRIGISAKVSPRLEDLIRIHQQHIFSVPFEDLDIYHGIPLKLDLGSLYEKVVLNERGGFCYELNYLFHYLLSEIGFKVRMVSARIFDKQKVLGPEYDHMALIVDLNGEEWLADVGFGELFIKPLKISDIALQKDLFQSFRVTPLDKDRYLLSMCKEEKEFEDKYIFETRAEHIESFRNQCEIKQTEPDSYFVRNKICTLPCHTGRKTIFNDKFIVRNNGTITIQLIQNEKREEELLAKHFNIAFETVTWTKTC